MERVKRRCRNLARILTIQDKDFPFPEIAKALVPHKDKPKHSVEFWVEMDNDKPVVSILYPGKKVEYRPPPKRLNWANLYDFVVQPYLNNKRIDPAEFTFEKLIDDFAVHKRTSSKFWELLEGIYGTDQLREIPPDLPGINSRLFLLVMKWIWIQEDFRYKYDWKEVKSRLGYIRLSKAGHRLGKGAGRAKSFAALVLLRNRYFSLREVKKIIPPY